MSVEAALDQIRSRWGSELVRPASTIGWERVPAFPSGLDALDRLTGLGGLPLGRLTGVTGRVGSGAASLLQRLAAAASREMVTAYLDLPNGLDPAFIAWLGADLERLYVVRPEGMPLAVAAIRALLGAGLPALFVHLDGRALQGDATLGSALPELARLASRSQTLFLVGGTAYVPRSPLAFTSSLWISMERVGWLGWHGDVVGVRARAQVVRSKLGPSGQEAELDLHYPVLGVPGFLEGMGGAGFQPLELIG
ncbi:MAG: P-loop NTPase family protein [Candidatus Dormibacteria bacterium]